MLEVGLTELVGDGADSLFHVVEESSLHSTAAVVEKCTQTLTFAWCPWAFVNCTNAFTLLSVLHPVVDAFTLGFIVHPTALVSLSSHDPVHYAFTLFFVLYPLTFVLIAWGVSHFSSAFS